MSKKLIELPISERIKRFREKHEKVDQSYFPDIWLYWPIRKNGENVGWRYLNTQTEVIHKAAPKWLRLSLNLAPSTRWGNEDDKQGIGLISCFKRAMVSSGSDLKMLVFKNDETLGIAELFVAKLDTRRKVPERKWQRYEEWSSIFFAKGDKTPRDILGNEATCFCKHTKNWWGGGYSDEALNFNHYIQSLNRIKMGIKSKQDFLKFWAGQLYGSLGYPITHSYDMLPWLLRNEKISNSAHQKKIDKLCAVSFKNVDSLINSTESEEGLYWKIPRNVLYIDDTLENYMVLRFFYRKRMGNHYADSSEGWRAFIPLNGKEVFFTRKVAENRWTSATNIAIGYHFYDGYIFGVEKLKQYNRTKSVGDLLETINAKPDVKLIYLISFLKYPILEQLCKAGYPRIAKDLCRYGGVNSNINNYFGKIAKKGGLYQKLGVTKRQLEYLECNWKAINIHNCGSVFNKRTVALIKEATGNNPSSLSLERFISLSNVLSQLSLKKMRHKSLLFFEDSGALKYWENIFKISQQPESPAFSSLVEQVLDTFKNLEMLPENIRPHITRKNMRTTKSIVDSHNLVMDFVIMNRKLIQEESKKQKEITMKKSHEAQEKWEIEDENFIIRLPRYIDEIMEEGASLHHCVAGYTEDHIAGYTTIFFLRRKENFHNSFYTIEVKKRDKKFYVTQIHGMYNRWLGNDPDVIPFVMQWLKKNNISCDDAILLSTASGYSSYGAPWVEKPKID